LLATADRRVEGRASPALASDAERAELWGPQGLAINLAVRDAVQIGGEERVELVSMPAETDK